MYSGRKVLTTLLWINVVNVKVRNVNNCSVSTCVHNAVNELQRSHWNFVLVLVKKKIIIVHYPMYFESRV